MNQLRNKFKAFTLIELLVVLAVIALLVFTLLPAMALTKAGAQKTTCTGNLKRIGVAVNSFALHNGGTYPMFVLNPPVILGGLVQKFHANKPAAAYMYEVFGIMSNELGTTKVVICPSDDQNVVHSNFFMGSMPPSPLGTNEAATFSNWNVSYFVGVDAQDQFPLMFLAGDRNIVGNGPGSTVLPYPIPNNGYGGGNASYQSVNLDTNFNLNVVTPAWTIKMHQNNGNVLLCDGSVQQFSASRLREALRVTGDTSTGVADVNSGRPNCVVFPNHQ